MTSSIRRDDTVSEQDDSRHYELLNEIAETKSDILLDVFRTTLSFHGPAYLGRLYRALHTALRDEIDRGFEVFFLLTAVAEESGDQQRDDPASRLIRDLSLRFGALVKEILEVDIEGERDWERVQVAGLVEHTRAYNSLFVRLTVHNRDRTVARIEAEPGSFIRLIGRVLSQFRESGQEFLDEVTSEDVAELAEQTRALEDSINEVMRRETLPEE